MQAACQNGRTQGRSWILLSPSCKPGHPATLVVSLAHVARQVSCFLREHAVALHAARLTQPALAQFGLLTKLGVLEMNDGASAPMEKAHARG